MKVIILLLTIFIGCEGEDSNKEVSTQLNLSVANKVKTFDPARVFDDDGLMVISQSIEPLYQYHYLKRPYAVIPALAEGMPSISPDKKTYTIKIKKGIHYHNNDSSVTAGRVVKARDFVMQMKRIAFKETQSLGTWLFSGKVKGFDEFARSAKSLKDLFEMEIPGIQALDEHTLKIDLIKPEPNLLYFLTLNFLSPIPEELVRAHKNDLTDTLVGTGAYYLEKVEEGSYHFARHPDFRKESYPTTGDRYANTQKLLIGNNKQLPFIDRVVFKAIPSGADRWSAFLEGELDILSVPKEFLDIVSSNPEDFQRRQKKLGFSVKYFSTVATRWLSFNMRDEVLGSNLKLRKAIAHAIDYERYIRVLTNNTNLRANSIFNPSIPGYLPGNELGYKYDVQKAKSLMKESGVKNLSITYSSRGTEKIHEIEAQLIKEFLERIGIEVKIELISFQDFLKKGRAGELQFFTDSWIYDYPDGENNIQLLVSSNSPGINKSGYRSKLIDRLYRDLSIELDIEKRAEIMHKVEDIIRKDLPWIMLMYDSSYILHSNKIKNFRKSNFIRNYIKYLEKR